MKLKLGKLVLAAMISIATLVNFPLFSDFVLCFGQDGHLELEFSSEGRCSNGANAPHEATLSDNNGVAHCGSCTDVRIMAEEASGSAKILEGNFAAGQLVDFKSDRLSAFLQNATPGLLPQPPPGRSLHLVHLRTVRLLV